MLISNEIDPFVTKLESLSEKKKDIFEIMRKLYDKLSKTTLQPSAYSYTEIMNFIQQ